MNNKLLILFLGILIIGIVTVNAQEIVDIGQTVFGLEEGIIIGWGVETGIGEEGILIEFVEEGAFLDINGNRFENIVPNTKEIAYVELSEEGEILLAEFTVNKTGNYSFRENEVVEIPAGMAIYYDIETGLEFRPPEGFDLSNLGNLLDYFNKGYIDSIKGQEIKILDGFNLIDGEIIITDKGYFLDSGQVNYKQNVFSTDSTSNSQILIANENSNMSDYEGNWIRQTPETLEMQSHENGHIKVDFLENHDILDTDDKDNLTVLIIDGDGLFIEKREESSLIPFVTHKSSEDGSAWINNDGIGFYLDKEGIHVSDTNITGLEFELIRNETSTPKWMRTLLKSSGFKSKYVPKEEKYQSIAMEIESDSPNIEEKLRINSYRQFAILSKENEELVTFNKYGLPISSLIKDNDMQSLDQLREKYPDIKFDVPSVIVLGNYYELNEFSSEENVPPYLFYLTDNFLEENPRCNKFEKIQYSNMFNAGVLDSSTLTIGRLSVDPSEPTFGQTRTTTSPLDVLEHECEHRLDNLIEDEEGFQILREVFYEYFSEKTLQQKYNELAINSITNSLTSDATLKSMEDFAERVKNNYVKPNVNSILDEAYGFDAVDYVKEAYGYGSREEVLENFGGDSQEVYKIVTESLLGVLSEEEKLKMDDMGYLLAAGNLFSEQIKMKNENGMLSSMGEVYSALYQYDDQSNLRNEFDQIIRQNTGVPFSYSIRNYNFHPFTGEEKADNFVENVPNSYYTEMSPTYREIPIEERARLVRSGNTNIQETFTKLTQLAFDSGKMDAEEYIAVMGSNQCENTDCSDQLCVEYKLLCCRENPESPNC